MNNTANNLTEVEEMGAAAFAAGIRAFILDNRAMAMDAKLPGLLNSPERMALVAAWNRGWSRANFAEVGA